MDPESLAALGLLGLFLAAFLAGSLLPFPSELVLLLLIREGVSAPLAVAVGTGGNVLGAWTLLAIGAGVTRAAGLAERVRAGADPERLARARRALERCGPPLLSLAFLPLVGDLLVLAAGLLRLRWRSCLLWITLGKLGRYAGLAWGAQALG